MQSNDLTKLLSNLSAEEYCYLTTTGRVTGKPHEIDYRWLPAGGVRPRCCQSGLFDPEEK